MELELIRDSKGDTWTAGTLAIDGKKFCDTLEDMVRDLKSEADKMPGRTAIPAGRYRITLTHSPRFKRTLPLLQRVPFFSGVRIHAGNSDTDTEGCILVGKRDSVAGRLSPGSRGMELALVDTLAREGGEIWITIKNRFAEADPKEGRNGPKTPSHKCNFI